MLTNSVRSLSLTHHLDIYTSHPTQANCLLLHRRSQSRYHPLAKRYRRTKVGEEELLGNAAARNRQLHQADTGCRPGKSCGNSPGSAQAEQSCVERPQFTTTAMISDGSFGAKSQRAFQESATQSPSPSNANGLYETQQYNKIYSQSHMTPPTTPNGSQEDLSPELPGPPIFHNFLRAFYPFHPNYAMNDSSVTLPLDEGDVVLVHSVHTNGWADGTLLASGARGWLPTNYCDPYEPDDLRSLLKALLNFWDLLRSTSVNDGEIFRNQEFMKGIIAGVRFLLVCLSQALAGGGGLVVTCFS